MAKPIPDNYHTVTPSFTFRSSQKALEFYKNAFGAEIIDLLPTLDGKGIMHATMQIGNSIIMMGDEMPGDHCAKSAESIGSSPITLYVYVQNVDETFSRAVAAGGKTTMPVSEMFWGDRVGQIKDPFGYSWMIATHKQDLTTEQIQKNAEQFFAQMSK